MKISLQISKVTHAWKAQRGEHQIQMAEITVSILTGVTFYCYIFWFSCGEVPNVDIAIVANFLSFVKVPNAHRTQLDERVLDKAMTPCSGSNLNFASHYNFNLFSHSNFVKRLLFLNISSNTLSQTTLIKCGK